MTRRPDHWDKRAALSLLEAGFRPLERVDLSPDGWQPAFLEEWLVSPRGDVHGRNRYVVAELRRLIELENEPTRVVRVAEVMSP